MKSFFKELFEYNHHYNQSWYALLEENQNEISEKALTLFNHIINAHQIWNNRITPQEKLFGVWEMHVTQDLKKIDTTNYVQSLQILDQFDFDKIIHYTNSQGKSFSNNVRNILFHVINHATYHRGQIATEYKQQGMKPLTTDYIFYKRLP